MAKEIKNTLYVERETYEKDDKTYFSYFIKGNIRGQNIKIGLMPPDKGGYTVLNIVFAEDNKAELAITPYEIKDDATGKIIKGNTYSAKTVDANGDVYECNVKPARNSDKSLLNMLLR